MTQAEFDQKMMELNSQLRERSRGRENTLQALRLKKHDELAAIQKAYSIKRLQLLQTISDKRQERNHYAKFSTPWNDYNGAIADCENAIQQAIYERDCKTQDCHRNYMQLIAEINNTFKEEEERIRLEKEDYITERNNYLLQSKTQN